VDNFKDIPEDGVRIVVHNPDDISIEKHNVKNGDVAKVVGRIRNCQLRTLAYNPEWNNNEHGHKCFTYQGPCIILWREEYEVIE